MKIEVTCRELKPFKEMVTVYALTFVPETRTFCMPLCIGDDWLQTMKCPILAVPNRVHLQWDKAFIEFEHHKDAAAFCAWLAEAEARAQEGYRTMQG
jgi:hypothetical protein